MEDFMVCLFPPVEPTTTVTQSITSPVTSLTMEASNSNDSHQMPTMEPIPALQNCIPTPAPQEEPAEPPEKKKKTVRVKLCPYSHTSMYYVLVN